MTRQSDWSEPVPFGGKREDKRQAEPPKEQEAPHTLDPKVSERAPSSRPEG